MSRMWTAEEAAMLIELYDDTSTAELKVRIGKPEKAIYEMAKRCGLKKSQEYLEKHGGRLTKDVGKKTRFQKGQTPWNKGLKGVNGKSNTTFKAGNVPHNHKPVGTVRTTKDGYPEVKIAEPDKWKAIHVVVWEKTHGPVPRGHVVRHICGDVMDPKIEDLELITLEENMRRNTVHRYPPKLKHALRLIKKLKREINERENN